MLFLTFWLLFGQAKSNKASRQLEALFVLKSHSKSKKLAERWWFWFLINKNDSASELKVES